MCLISYKLRLNSQIQIPTVAHYCFTDLKGFLNKVYSYKTLSNLLFELVKFFRN